MTDTIFVPSFGNRPRILVGREDILRQFDEIGVDVIYSESFATPKMGQAIMNRLLKAAGQKTIEV